MTIMMPLLMDAYDNVDDDDDNENELRVVVENSRSICCDFCPSTTYFGIIAAACERTNEFSNGPTWNIFLIIPHRLDAPTRQLTN